MIDLYDTMNVTPKASRSEVLRLPVIQLAKAGDPKALEYLRLWTEEDPGKELNEMNIREAEAVVKRRYRDLLIEKRRRDLGI